LLVHLFAPFAVVYHLSTLLPILLKAWLFSFKEVLSLHSFLWLYQFRNLIWGWDSTPFSLLFSTNNTIKANYLRRYLYSIVFSFILIHIDHQSRYEYTFQYFCNSYDQLIPMHKSYHFTLPNQLFSYVWNYEQKTDLILTYQ